MGKVLCYSVKIKRIEKITHKSYKIFSFNGMVDILPASQIYGIDTETKGLSYWVSAWILEKKNIQYSDKKKCFFDERGNKYPFVEIKHHVPQKYSVVNNYIAELRNE